MVNGAALLACAAPFTKTGQDAPVIGCGGGMAVPFLGLGRGGQTFVRSTLLFFLKLL
jgi:hypothetical protein